MEYKSPSIILRTIDFGEADRLVTFFTSEHGKQKGVAKNAKKSARRFGGGLEPGSVVMARYVDRSGAEIVRFEDVVVEFPVWRIATSLPKIAMLGVSLELADKMLPAGLVSKGRFELLVRWIRFLAEEEPREAHLHAFFCRWLSASGLNPVFDKCASCSAPDAASWFISIQHGGLICDGCVGSNAEFKVDAATKAYLTSLSSGTLPQAGSKTAGDIFEAIVTHAAASKLRSLDVLHELK